MRVTDPKTGRSRFKKCRYRFDGENTPRELTFSCYKGLKFLGRDRTRVWFIEALQQALHIWSVDLWAWVIMPEHVHLIVMPREPNTPVGQFLGDVKQEVARKAILWLEENAAHWLKHITVREGRRLRRRFWQPGGGYDRNVESLATLETMIEYLHLNPVRRGLVERAIDWPWSSARWYAGISPVPIEIDSTFPTFHTDRDNIP
jgi:putative transposase